MIVVMMAMSVIMWMIMIMMVMPVLVVMNPLRRAAAARILAEQERLDGDRHGVGRHPDAPEVDVVEVAQDDAVDRQDLALDQELLAQDGAQRLRDVAVEHDVDRLLALDGGGEPV